MRTSALHNSDAFVLPDRVELFLRTLGADEETRTALLHCFRIFKDLGFRLDEPFGDAFLYSYLLDGKTEIGERLRRTLQTEEIEAAIGRKNLHRWNVSSTDTEHVTYFANTAKHSKIVSELSSYGVKEARSAAVLLMPLLSSSVGGALGIVPQLDNILRRGLPVEERVHSLLSALWEKRSSLEIPGKYVLVITDSGKIYQADLVQTLIHGKVKELSGRSAVSETFSVTYPWLAQSTPAIQTVLLEFEALVNSAVSKEADFQRFFNSHPEFLYLMGNYDDVRAQVTIRIDVAISPLAQSSTLRPDFLLHSPLTDLWDLLDIKKAYYSTPLLVGSGRNAHHSVGPSQILSKALSQMRQYKIAFQQANVRDFVLARYGLRTAAPRCILLMGRLENFPTTEGFSQSQVLANITEPHGVDLITYDQLNQISRHSRL